MSCDGHSPRGALNRVPALDPEHKSLVTLTQVAGLKAAYAGGPAGSRSCKTLLSYCVARKWGNPEQCQILYNAAVEEGGIWGSPAARAAAKVPSGAGGSCHPD
jgi:hypothetical protein